MKISFSSTLVLFPFLLLAQTLEEPDAIAFLDNISIMDKINTLNSGNNKRSFQLEVCVAEYEKTQVFSKNMKADVLTTGLTNSNPKLFLISKPTGSIRLKRILDYFMRI